jgi:hypothetical protein
MNVHLSPTARARQEKRDLLMDALVRAKRRADYDDWETYNEGEDDEVCLQTFAEVQWETVGFGNDPDAYGRAAVATITGARLGNILIDPDTLDAAFPGSVAKIEERLSEQFTRNGEWS